MRVGQEALRCTAAARTARGSERRWPESAPRSTERFARRAGRDLFSLSFFVRGGDSNESDDIKEIPTTWQVYVLFEYRWIKARKRLPKIEHRLHAVNVSSVMLLC